MPKALSLINKRFGRLLVLKRLENNRFGNTQWLCKCDCGNEKIEPGGTLNSGDAISCGCFRTEFLINRNKTQLWNQLEKGEAGFNTLKRTYKKSAKIRNLEFKLTDDQLKNLFKGNCFYCNCIPNQSSNFNSSMKKTQESLKHSELLYNGLDRVDNTRGYIKENCVPCCKYCNFMKHALNLNEFKKHIKQIYFNWASK